MKKSTNTSVNDRLLAPSEAAEHLGVSAGTLAVWRSTGRYAIPFVKVGRLVKYPLAALEAWIEQRTRFSGATA